MTSDGKLRRPHVVPRGYLRNFAAGDIVRVVEKSSRTQRLQGTKDTFVQRNFLRVILADGQASDWAEDATGIVENLVLPGIRTVTPGVDLDDGQDAAVKGAMALLWARSYAGEVVRRRIYPQVVEEERRRFATDAKIRRKFITEYRRQPEPGELDRMVDDAHKVMRSNRRVDIDAMLRHHNDAVEYFWPHSVEVYQPAAGHQFITSDNPVTIAPDGRLLHLGIQNGLALHDAGFIFLPISPAVGVCLVQNDPAHRRLTPQLTARLNNATWRNAIRYIAAHPSADWSTLCGVKGAPRH